MGKYLPIVETELFRFFIDKGDQKCLCVDCGSDEVRNNEAEKNEHLWTKCPEWVHCFIYQKALNHPHRYMFW